MIYDKLCAALAAPCENERDQQVHDRLVRFDSLYAEGHSKACAVSQVWGNKECSCTPENKMLTVNS